MHISCQSLNAMITPNLTRQLKGLLMTMKWTLCVVLALFVYLITSVAFAEVPTSMQFQGYLTDAEGEPLVGVYSIIFTLYDEVEDGNAIWTERLDVAIDSGSFSAKLGDINPLDPNIFGDDILWMSIAIGQDDELSPRSPISSVPYATRASVADNAMTETDVQSIIDDGSYLTGYDESDPTVNALAKAILNCGTDEIAKWDGEGWICSVDTAGITDETDPIYLQAPASGIDDDDIASWRACYDWGNHADAYYLTNFTETDPTVNSLAKTFLDCANGDVARFNGADWECSLDVNTTYSGADFALSDQICPEGQKVAGVSSSGAIVCEVDIDTITDTQYSGADFALSDQDCPVGMVVSGISTSGAVQCEDDDGITDAHANLVLF